MPMVQAGSSTILSILVLALIHAYMVQVFVKVVTLVVGLGMMHGLVVLPIVYTALPFSKIVPEEQKHDKKKKIVPVTDNISIHSIKKTPPLEDGLNYSSTTEGYPNTK